MIKKTTVLVTGASGFVGQVLVKHLLEDGYKVKVLTRKPFLTWPPQVFAINGDLLSPESFPIDFLDDVSAIINCAGELSDFKKMFSLHVNGTRHLLDLASSRPSTSSQNRMRWIQISSVGAYGPVKSPGTPRVVIESTVENPLGEYESTKTMADNLLREASNNGLIDLTILRPANIFGINMPNRSLRNFIHTVKKGKFFYIGTLHTICNYVHVDDVAHAIALCLSNPASIGKTYNISHDCALKDLTDSISDAFGIRRPKLVLPEFLIRFLNHIFEGYSFWPLSTSRIDALISKTRYPTTLIQQELGFAYSRPIEKSILSLINHDAAKSTCSENHK